MIRINLPVNFSVLTWWKTKAGEGKFVTLGPLAKLFLGICLRLLTLSAISLRLATSFSLNADVLVALRQRLF